MKTPTQIAHVYVAIDMLQISTNAVPVHARIAVAVRILSMASFVRAFRVIREPDAALVRTIT